MGNKRRKVRIVIDGREVEADYRAPLIDAAAKIGIVIPTLCNHGALEPAGACRLCLVEQVRDGWSKFVTACNYPVEDGMIFRTSSDEVLRQRRMTVESLLARCPDVPVIRDLAARMGIERSRFTPGDDTCILCSLCTRVCETYATSAIGMLARGQDKVVGTFAGEPPDDCVGCGSCVKICPTGHIHEERGPGAYKVWDRVFNVAVCGVDTRLCIGCGACEESCPFSVARVILKSDGTSHAEIDLTVCRGCGVCLASCPSGAITQPRVDRRLPAKGSGLLVIACGRANFGKDDFPRGVTLMEMQCSGGADIPTLLGALARRFDGVLVMGRHQETCRLDGAEAHARDMVRRVDLLAALCGLGAGRVMFAEPAPGPVGPLQMIRAALRLLFPNPLSEPLPEKMATSTLADAFGIVQWLGGRKELVPDGSAWLSLNELPQGSSEGASIDAGAIPYFDLLLSDLLRPADLAGYLWEALELADSSEVIQDLPGQKVRPADDTKSPDTRPGITVGPFRSGNPIPDRQRIAEIQARLEEAAERGEKTLEVHSIEDLVAHLITCRTGSWRRTHVRPVLSVKDALGTITDDKVSR